ncbi:MAG: L-histidine N(alpha)-methyltransferase [Spirochaetota bacterium]|nr:L-histidine N(alpha)-methyltransferase [Spirochaetota bacterium]
MTLDYRVLQKTDYQLSDSHHDFALNVLLGLSQYPKSVPSRYLYDAEGDKLFQQIMNLPEYYLTQCEFEILQNHKDQIIDLVFEDQTNLIELGAGDGQKTEILLEHLINIDLNFEYVPIDISESSIKGLVSGLKKSYPEMKIEGLVAEYFEGLKWLSCDNQGHNVVLFLGSSIGNFSHSEARVFLFSLWNALNDGDIILIGFDLKKDIQTLTKAYNDSQGITARFNLNLLNRINKELGGNFDPDCFQYHNTYNVFTGAMESYLVSCEEQNVYIKELNQFFSFESWESLHTEYSHKYLLSEISALAEETGFNIIHQFSDSRQYYIDSLWQVVKR